MMGEINNGYKVKVKVVDDGEIGLSAEGESSFIFCDKKSLASDVMAQISRVSKKENKQPGAIILSCNLSVPVLFVQVEQAKT